LELESCYADQNEYSRKMNFNYLTRECNQL